MRVFLLNPPYRPYFIRSARWAAQSISGSNWYPIWLAYCTGLLEKHGHEARLLDAIVEGLTSEETIERIRDFSPQLLVVYISTPSLKNDVDIAVRAKELIGAKIILVGPWCSVDPQSALTASDKVDGIAIGEFDFTVLEVADGHPWAEIKGLYWRSPSGKLITNPPREPANSKQLDEFPFVTDIYRRFVPIHKYVEAPQLHPFVDLFTGRGCAWGKCTFCLWPFTITRKSPYRLRSMDGVIEELKFVKKELPYVKEVFIQDDTLPEDRARELATAILDNNVKIVWSCYSRAETSYETLKLMRQSGCRTLHVGYESSDPTILKLINKGINPETAQEFTKNASKLGFLIHADFIVGLPGETAQTIERTIKWAKTLDVHSYQFTILKPYPNTPAYTWLEKHDAMRDGRLQYDDLSHEDMERWVKTAILRCHFNPPYILRMLRQPSEWGRLAASGRHVLRNTLLK